MQKKWKWIGILVGVLVGLVLLVWVVGWTLPAEHTATRTAVYSRPPEEVWRVITDIERFTAWRSGLESVQRLRDRDGRPVWIEKSSSGEMPLEVVEWDPPRRMITWISDSELPFGGTWTYELTPVEGGTELRITERGRIHNPFFRFMARFIFGYATTIEQYLNDLGRHFGETVSITE